MKDIHNKEARRQYERMARRFLLWHSSQSTVFAKKVANRRVRYAAIEDLNILNGGGYKALADLRFVRED